MTGSAKPPSTEPPSSPIRAGLASFASALARRFSRRKLTGREPAPEPALSRHDVAVVLILALVLAAGAAIHRADARPNLERAEHGGLTLQHPSGWIAPPLEPSPSPPLARAVGALANEDLRGHDATARSKRWQYISPEDPSARIEIEIIPRPPHTNIPAARALARAAEFGERYWRDETVGHPIAGRDWFRTAYRYADKGGPSPSAIEAVEYAATSGDDLYVVTFRGRSAAIEAFEHEIAKTLMLRAEARTGGAR